MILADTSVWVDHLRAANEKFEQALERGEIIGHPFVQGELACGNIRNRAEVLRLVGRLTSPPLASHGEVLRFIERWRLSGRGLGWVDVHLLASVALAGDAQLWTRDRRLHAAATDVGLAYHRS